jgi:LytS/YehU family sensor histidine kinase
MHNDCMVDGGRDYFRRNLKGKPVKMKVIKDELVVVGDYIDYAYDTGLPL